MAKFNGLDNTHEAENLPVDGKVPKTPEEECTSSAHGVTI